MNSIKFALVAPAPQDEEQRNLAEILRLAALWLGPDWHFVRPDQAGLLIVSINGSEESLALWRDYRQTFPVDRMVAHGSDGIPSEAEWRIAKTAGVESVVSLLLRIEESYWDRTLASGAFAPNGYIQGIIAEARSDGLGRFCSLSGEPDLYLLPGQAIGYITGHKERLIPYFAAGREQIYVTPIRESDFLHKLRHTGFPPQQSKQSLYAASGLPKETGLNEPELQTLDELIWFATLVNSRGRLLAECRYEDSLHISNWPAFLEAPAFEEYRKLRILLSRERLSLLDLATVAGLPMRQIIDFHNACRMLNLFEKAKPSITPGDATPIPPITRLTGKVSEEISFGRIEPIMGLANEIELEPLSLSRSNSKNIESEAVVFTQPSGIAPDPDERPGHDAPSSMTHGTGQDGTSWTETDREDLYRLFGPIGETRKAGIKIVIAGPLSAGKISAIDTLHALSESGPAAGQGRQRSENPEVGVDFHEIYIKDLKIFLYGTPGHRRLEFMGQNFCAGAWGLIVLIDHSQADPVAELQYYLDLYKTYWRQLKVIVGITHYESFPTRRIEDYSELLASHHLPCPVITVDTCNPANMRELLQEMVGEANRSAGIVGDIGTIRRPEFRP